MSNADIKLKAYEAEVARKKLLTIFYSIIVLTITFFLVYLFTGEHFNEFLVYLGIHPGRNYAGGVYADCTLEENKDIEYCKPKTDPKQREWQMLRNGGDAPFTLYKN